MQTAIETIMSATIQTVPTDFELRGKGQKARTEAIRRRLWVMGIRGVSVTMARGSMCFWTDIKLTGVACKDPTFHKRDACPQCQINLMAERRLTEIILAAFPDLEDRSDSQSDHFDSMFSIHIEEPPQEPAKPAAPPAVQSLAPDGIRAAQPESSPAYEAIEPLPLPPPVKVFNNSTDIYMACRDLEKQDREHFIIFFLDVRHRLVGDRWTCAIGSVAGVETSPREIYREALLRNAVCIICVHNHPSGDPTPSRQDLDFTRRIKEAGDMLGLRLLDHIVIGDGVFASMASRGML